jgi:arylsulfatase A-like enzyme
LNPETAEWNHPALFTHMGQDYGSNAAKALAGEKAAVHSGVPYFVAVRHGPYKYVRYLGAEEPAELYDLKSDPEELTNLAGSETHRETKERLHKMLRDELTRADADFLGAFDQRTASP